MGVIGTHKEWNNYGTYGPESLDWAYMRTEVMVERTNGYDVWCCYGDRCHTQRNMGIKIHSEFIHSLVPMKTLLIGNNI